MEQQLATVKDILLTMSQQFAQSGNAFYANRVQAWHNSLDADPALAEKYNTQQLRLVCLRVLNTINAYILAGDAKSKENSMLVIDFDIDALAQILPVR